MTSRVLLRRRVLFRCTTTAAQVTNFDASDCHLELVKQRPKSCYQPKRLKPWLSQAKKSTTFLKIRSDKIIVILELVISNRKNDVHLDPSSVHQKYLDWGFSHGSIARNKTKPWPCRDWELQLTCAESGLASDNNVKGAEFESQRSITFFSPLF